MVIPPNLPSHCGKFKSTIAHFSQFSLIILITATVNCIPWRYAATGILVPGKSTGAPRKTTPHQDHPFLRMVRHDRFINAPALTAQMRNLGGMSAGQKIINNLLLLPIDPQGNLCWLPANHRFLCLEWAQRCLNLTMAYWQHVIFSDMSRFQFFLVDGRLRVHLLPDECFQQRCQAYRVQTVNGSVHVWRLLFQWYQIVFCAPWQILHRRSLQGRFAKHLCAICQAAFQDNYWP